jgi:hypothetical protein
MGFQITQQSVGFDYKQPDIYCSDVWGECQCLNVEYRDSAQCHKWNESHMAITSAGSGSCWYESSITIEAYGI